MNEIIEDMIIRKGVRPTSNRILILRYMLNADRPMSLSELDDALDTVDKSSIFRVLTTLSNAGILHTIEDGRGVTHYEICHGDHNSEGEDDSHVHFFCRICKGLTCLENLPLPHVNLPEGFNMEGGNYMLKGICPKCSKKQ